MCILTLTIYARPHSICLILEELESFLEWNAQKSFKWMLSWPVAWTIVIVSCMGYLTTSCTNSNVYKMQLHVLSAKLVDSIILLLLCTFSTGYPSSIECSLHSPELRHGSYLHVMFWTFFLNLVFFLKPWPLITYLYAKWFSAENLLDLSGHVIDHALNWKKYDHLSYKR